MAAAGLAIRSEGRFAFAARGRIRCLSTGQDVETDQFYRIDDRQIAQAFSSAMPGYLADLVDVAMAVYFADRLLSRRPAGTNRSQPHWSRHTELSVPVRDPERWNDADLRTQLEALLWLFTEDEWVLSFVRRPGDPRSAEAQVHLFPEPPRRPVTTALFSGGLDSLAGLGRELTTRPNDTFVLVSAYTNSRLGHLQRRLIRELRDRYQHRILSVAVPFAFRPGGTHHPEQERTQRSRGFVYMALGAVTALMAGIDVLTIYENGVGAINLPYTEAQLGTQNTRAVHPFALAKMAGFVQAATGHLFRFENPFLFSTNGQMCSFLCEPGLSDLVARTASCDGYPLRDHEHLQCGACTSCLLRRSSLYQVGSAHLDPAEHYAFDVLRFGWRLPEPRLRPLRAMSDQVRRIRTALAEPDAWRALSFLFPQLLEVALTYESLGKPQGEAEHQLLCLYRTYCLEWRQFETALPHSPANRAA